MLDSQKAAATHYKMTLTVMPDYYNRKTQFGQSFFLKFPDNLS